MAERRFDDIRFGAQNVFDAGSKGLGTMGDRGTVSLFPDRVEFDGKKAKVTLRDVRSVELTSIPGGMGAKRITVVHGPNEAIQQAYFSAAWNTPKHNRRVKEMAGAMIAAYGSAPRTADQQQAMQRFEAAARTQRGKAGRRNMVIGAILAIGGLLVTVITYSAASSSSSGGTYFVAYGPMIFGVIMFISGLVESSKASKASRAPSPRPSVAPPANPVPADPAPPPSGAAPLPPMPPMPPSTPPAPPPP